MGQVVIRWKDIGICSVYFNTPFHPPAPVPALPPVDKMLVGPYPPTHGSSYLFRDAMERRGRSRAIPTTAVIRKSHRHQRQLYYSHYPANPPSPSPSPSPVRSPLYVSLDSPHFPWGSPLTLSHLNSSDESTSPQSTTLEPVTPPEISLDYYESPPTPPQSLEDQIHEAYALDNIHLAKILYLKLQGVHVADDSDPRIEQVREEDFPFGSLILDEEDERSLKECERRERHRRRDQQRANKLAQCERAWDQSIVEYRQQCLLVRQRNQAAALAISEQHRLDTEGRERQEHRSRVHLSGPGARSLLSSKPFHDAPSHSTPGSSYPLEYSVPTNPSSPVDIPSRSLKSSELRREPPPVLSPSQSVSFQQVFTCMNDALFPNDDAPTDPCGRKRQSHGRAALLEVLLQPVAWERGERSEARIRRRSSLPSFSTWSSNVTLCSACPSSSGSSSTLESSQSVHQFVGVRRLTISTSKPTTYTSTARMRPTSCSVHSLTPIDLQECPLFFQKRSYPQPNAPPSVLKPKPRSHFATSLVRKIGTSVSTFMDVAAQFQASYMRTAGFIVQLENCLPDDEIPVPSWSTEPPTVVAKANARSKAKISLPFSPTNPRAKINEATAFIKGCAWSEANEEIDPAEDHYTLVELLTPSERRSPSAASSPSAFITPSPLRPREVPNSLRYRIRPIANPVLLRLKALQNVCAGEGVEWEGRAREGALGFGCDRLQGVAFDGIGKSRLSWEVSF